MTRRAALLLEVMLALAIFTMAGLAILSTLGQAMSRVQSARERERAVDAARSALALIEAGLASPESLTGPINWSALAGRAEQSVNVTPDDVHGAAGAADSAWRLHIDTQPTTFPGLTLMVVTVTDGRAGDAAPPLAVLSQLLPLRAGGEGELDITAMPARRTLAGGAP